MIEAEAGRIDNRAKALDHTAVDQLAHANLARRFRHPDLFREIGNGDSTIAAQNGEDFTIERIQIGFRMVFGHPYYLQYPTT
ncbi:hypothetical protein GCM10011349_27650 [Novosphingobium indicum]|uniref:Uncharacterized protein n=1 Tax=Novosphingobium indicum TaxID=462949 RepID=A0ABQ2JTR1_9SPHN|nr:hypothetical protein GCM10011349_27650 [Novosphingobium indicum]